MNPTSTHRAPVAAPPDHGGHVGSFSQPDDQLDVHDGQPVGGPDLSRDPNPRRDARPGSGQVAFLLLLLLVTLPLLWHFFTR